MATVKQYINDIFKEIELCPKCGRPMEITNQVQLTMPPKYCWVCDSCNETVYSVNDDQPHFTWKAIEL